MIDKSSLLKSQGSLYLEFIPKDGLFHKMLLLSLKGFLTGWCNLLCKQEDGEQVILRQYSYNRRQLNKKGTGNTLSICVSQVLFKNCGERDVN